MIDKLESDKIYSSIDCDDPNGDMFSEQGVNYAMKNPVILDYNTDNFVAYVIYKDNRWYCELHKYWNMFEFDHKTMKGIIKECNTYY